MAAGGARAGGAMGMLSPVYTDEGQTLSTADYLRAKGVNTAADAIAGAVAAPVAKVGLERIVAPAVGKMVNTVRGVVDPALQEIQQLGQKYGVRLSTGDITQNALPKRAEVALESVPVVGTGGFRAAQQAEASTAAKGVADDMREAMINAPFKGIDQVEKAAADGNKVAIALKNELANAGDDWNKIVQASGNLQAFRTKQIADKLYGQVEQMAANAGNVPAFGTIRAIDEALAEATSSKLPDDSIISMLRKLKESMAGKKVDITDPVMIGSGEATQTVRMPDTDFSSMRKLRSDLGDMISDYYKGANAVTGSKGVGLLQRVRSGVEQDMQDFALNSGRDDLASAWRRADRFYRERVVPYKDRSLATALKDAPADEVFGRFIQAGKGERARNFYGALDPKGQAAVRYGMVANAMDKALDETRNVFSPAKFAGALDRIREAQGAFFRGDARREIDGFSKLMRHVERAGQFAENPPTGARTIPWLLGGAAAMNAPLAAKAAAVAGVAKALLTTAPGKRFLLASSKLEEGSPAMDKLLKRINQVMPKYSGISASDAVRNSQQPEVGDE
ncbi:hypothetical protein [Dyella sp.]|uniref:hypothetical protein n=1 Tax=Dyella sp. TaxID=1869338 RepID=UPI002FDA5564